MKHSFNKHDLTGQPIDDYEKPFYCWVVHEIKRPFSHKFSLVFLGVQMEWIKATFRLLVFFLWLMTYPVSPVVVAIGAYFIKRRAWRQFGVEELINNKK